MSWNKGKASGYTLKSGDAPIIFGMVARDDRDHDIAAWFGVNQGRIAEVKDGTKFGTVAAAPADDLPTRGPPGIKGRRLRNAVDRALVRLERDGASRMGVSQLLKAISDYDRHEA